MWRPNSPSGESTKRSGIDIFNVRYENSLIWLGSIRRSSKSGSSFASGSGMLVSLILNGVPLTRFSSSIGVVMPHKRSKIRCLRHRERIRCLASPGISENTPMRRYVLPDFRTCRVPKKGLKFELSLSLPLSTCNPSR